VTGLEIATFSVRCRRFKRLNSARKPERAAEKGSD
jgi:hypothetical protein